MDGFTNRNPASSPSAWWNRATEATPPVGKYHGKDTWTLKRLTAGATLDRAGARLGSITGIDDDHGGKPAAIMPE
jgi:hypothetical protein